MDSKEKNGGKVYRGNFALYKEPVEYIISVHISNLINTVNLSYSDKLTVVNRLILTYGKNTTMLTVKDFFPEFFKYLTKAG